MQNNILTVECNTFEVLQHLQGPECNMKWFRYSER